MGRMRSWLGRVLAPARSCAVTQSPHASCTPPQTPQGDPAVTIPQLVKDTGAGLLVTDYSPLRLGRQWRDQAGYFGALVQGKGRVAPLMLRQPLRVRSAGRRGPLPGAPPSRARQGPRRPPSPLSMQVGAALGGTAFHEVDAHNVVPVWEASDKREYGARTIRWVAAAPPGAAAAAVRFGGAMVARPLQA
jgi:hypothetical protein